MTEGIKNKELFLYINIMPIWGAKLWGVIPWQYHQESILDHEELHSVAYAGFNHPFTPPAPSRT